jgi:MFS family permease
MVISAIFFQTSLWHLFFWLNGFIIILLGILILKGKEQKRAANQSELKEALSDDSITYNYKLNKETIRSTVLSKTNFIAFAEGIFTTVVLAVPDFLLTAYLQSPPFNISPLVSSLFMIIFGIPGGVLGAIIFAKLSDRLAKKSIKNRIYMIIFSIVSMYVVYVILFSVPLPHLTTDEGNNLLFIFSFPVIWIMGVCALMARSVMGLYNINQPPVLQKINLPEAQGIVSSSNQFLELIGSGTGPILAGILLIVFNHNYQITVFLTMGIGILGAFMWILATVWIEKDVNRVSSILKQRGEELNGKHNNKIEEILLEN